MSSSSSEFSYGSSSSRETPPEIRAPEEWDLEDHTSSIWSEDNQSLTSGEEDLRFLVDEDLDSTGDDSSDDEDGDEAPVEGYGSSDEGSIGSSADEGSEDDDEGSDGP